MASKRPLIGVTGPDRGGWSAWFFTRMGILWAGGRARRLTPGKKGRFDDLDGLILGGGADLDPVLYGQEPIPDPPKRIGWRRRLRHFISRLVSWAIFVFRKASSLKRARIDHDRDEFEIRVLKSALERKIPVLGICRGSQLLNVHHGGTLHQDVAGFYTETPQVHSIFPRKWVNVEDGTCLKSVLGTSRCKTNSLHHQAVDQLGEGLRVAACEDTGVVQAIERRDCWLLGVQWHPEYLPQLPEQRRLFRQLVDAASNRPQPLSKEPPCHRVRP